MAETDDIVARLQRREELFLGGTALANPDGPDGAAEIERLRDLFRLDGEQHAQHIKGLTEAHEARITKYATALAERDAQIERLTAGKEAAATEIVRLVKERDEAHANHQWAQARLDHAEARAETAERERDEARAEVERKDAALKLAYETLAEAFGRIHGLPRTSDTTLANRIGQTRAKIETALTQQPNEVNP